VLAAGERAPVVIVPALDGGTALLYRQPPRCIPESFGADSAARHRREAERAGLEALELPDIESEARADLDTLEDAERILRWNRPCRTREVLEKLLR
jgi:2-phospho-L-lactate guanylyltransferase (CobY/MobA/RfbA family)